MPDTTEAVKALRDQILDIIKGAGKDFLDQNSAVKDLLIERAETLAKYALQYKLEGNEDKRAEIKHEMEIVQQTIQNELSAIALASMASSRAVFMKIVDTAVAAFIKFLPMIVGAI